MRKRKLPAYIFTIYIAHTFFTKGIDSGLNCWRFYASLFSLLGVIALLFLINKWERKSEQGSQDSDKLK